MERFKQIDEFIVERMFECDDEAKMYSSLFIVKQALQRNIPKKVIHKIEGMGWLCPNQDCRIKHFDDEPVSFCKHCGQAIDWSE